MRAPPPALDLSLALLSRGIANVRDHGRAAFGALVSGALVEMGADPRPAFMTLAVILGRTLPPMARFLARCEAIARSLDPEDEDPHHKGVMAAAASQEPDGAAAWEAMHTLYRPAVAVLSPSAEGRALARAELTQDAAVLQHHDGGGLFIWKLLQVLDDEALLVLHPAQSRGARLRISGIGDNFQLHVLLMDELLNSGILEGATPHPDWVAVARGDGPQELSATVTGAWNLYQWSALAGRRALVEGQDGSEHWIWNEGVPADIRTLDGERVILLGEPTYPRTWNNSRVFAHMRPEVVLEEVLERDEVEARLAVIQRS